MPSPQPTAVAPTLPAPQPPTPPRVVERRRAERRVTVVPVVEERRAPSMAAGTGLLLELALNRDSRYETEAARLQRDFRVTAWLCVATGLVYAYDALLFSGTIPGLMS